jgi:glycosyltransferase involved in cell wall biosynthesis
VRQARLQILFVAEYYFANLDLVKLSEELAKRKHHVSVATSFRNFDKRESYKGVDMFEINPYVTIHSVPHSLSFPISQIRKLVRRHDVEIIHALMDYSTNTASAYLVSKATDTPFVYNVQGMGTRTGKFVVDALADGYDWTIERLISRDAKKLILPSKSVISRTRKLGVADSKVVVIPTGVDCKRFDPKRPEVERKAAELRNDFDIGQDDFVIGYVGRLVPAKGLPYLLTAVNQIKHEFPNVVLLVVGDGPQRAELELKAKDLNLKTAFAGYQTDTPPYYSLMDVFVLPSFFEGLSGVVLEAMAMEKSVVATNVGGTSDLVTYGENGFLVPIKNAEKIASTLKRLVANESLRVQMGKRGREIVEKSFQWDVIVDKVEAVYKEVA